MSLSRLPPYARVPRIIIMGLLRLGGCAMAEAARDVLRGSFSRTPRAKRAKAKRMPAVLPMGMGSMITITQCTAVLAGEYPNITVGKYTAVKYTAVQRV